MAPITLRNVIGTVKDRTSIGLAKVSNCNMSSELRVAIIKATTHSEELPPNEKYTREILLITSYSPRYVHACIVAVSKRLGKTRDWIVALKALMLIHKLINEGNPLFQEELFYATWKGSRIINMHNFTDEAHSCSWDYSSFIRTYSMYLDQRLSLLLFERKGSSIYGVKSPCYKPHLNDDHGDIYDGESDFGRHRRTRSFNDFRNWRDDGKTMTPLREMKLEMVFGKMEHLQRLLHRFIACRPTGLSKDCRMVLVAVYPVLRESYQLYKELSEVLTVLLDKFFDMEYQDCVKTFNVYVVAAKQMDELIQCYNWWKDMGVTRTTEYPQVERISIKVLESLKEFVRTKAKGPEKMEEPPPAQADAEEVAPGVNEIKALPLPEDSSQPPQLETKPKPEMPEPKFTGNLVDLSEDSNIVTTDDHGNRLALALFGEQASHIGNGSWEAFPSNEEQVTSAWQTPAAEIGKSDWELVLVETASKLTKQKASLGGGFDPFLLNNMYDQGMLRQEIGTAQLSGGSASSVAFPGPVQGAMPVLALPAPDKTNHPVNQDPFLASLSIQPPHYVQMAEMEKKQHLLVQEQQLWQQYSYNGMQGQASLSKFSGGGYFTSSATPMAEPYAMPAPPFYGMSSQAGHYSAPSYRF